MFYYIFILRNRGTKGPSKSKLKLKFDAIDSKPSIPSSIKHINVSPDNVFLANKPSANMSAYTDDKPKSY